jgi:hypothetical protein
VPQFEIMHYLLIRCERRYWNPGPEASQAGGGAMSKTKAVVIILVGIALCILGVLSSTSGFLSYVMWVIAIGLIVCGVILYANESRKE